MLIPPYFRTAAACGLTLALGLPSAANVVVIQPSVVSPAVAHAYRFQNYRTLHTLNAMAPMKQECGPDGCGDPGNGGEPEEEVNPEGDIIAYTQSQSTISNVIYENDGSGFPGSSAFIADYGTNKIGPKTGPDLEAHGQLHLTTPCWNALQALNRAFLYDLGKAGFADIAAWVSAPVLNIPRGTSRSPAASCTARATRSWTSTRSS